MCCRMGKTQSVPTLVVGKLGPSTTIIEPLLQLRDTEGSEIQVSLKNKRDGIQKPKKGEIKFCIFYYISNASYKLSLKKKVKKITLDVVTFQEELHLFKKEYSFGDITRVSGVERKNLNWQHIVTMEAISKIPLRIYQYFPQIYTNT